MSRFQRAIEFKVGIFVLIGLAVIGGLTMYFGRVGEALKKYYDLTVQLPNAGGLLKKSEVQLSGARVGFVDTKPQIAAGNIGLVKVKLKMYDEVKIPRDASFKVASSGLLGDVFVEVILSPDFDPAKFDPNDPKQVWQNGETVAGKPTAGLEELTKKGGQTLDDLRASLAELKTTVASLNTKLLTDENARNVKETLAHLNVTSASFVETSKKLDVVIQNAQGAVDATKQTMTTANAAATDLRTTVVDARKAIGSAKEAFDAYKDLAKKAANGDGLLGTLISNRELSNNLKALVGNLKERGVLFYKDSARGPAPAPASTKPGTRTR